jgi:hypothetical protein
MRYGQSERGDQEITVPLRASNSSQSCSQPHIGNAYSSISLNYTSTVDEVERKLPASAALTLEKEPLARISGVL